MKTVKINCINLECPMPVIKAKNTLEENEEVHLQVIVDNEVAKDNVSKLAKSMNLQTSFEKHEDNFVVDIIKKSGDVSTKEISQGQVILIKTNLLGQGDEKLGAMLMKAFIFSLTQSKPYPEKIIFLNSGVQLTTTNEETVKNLKILEKENTQIVSCGTCLDFYNLKESLQVGSIGNMYDIVDSLNKTDNKLSI